MKQKTMLFAAMAALFYVTSCAPKKEKEKELPLTPETALQHYLQNEDSAFHWELADTYKLEDGRVTAYDLVLTSQIWREHTWKHQLTILKPEEVLYDEALLFITGGSVKEGQPNFKGHDDGLTLSLAAMAKKNKAVISIINQVPNQPLYDNLTEDQLISFTLHNYQNDGDLTWPLLFPMVKSAVKGMDAVQEYCKKELGTSINSFLVSGASKRGWTTWLTGSQDSRVIAIAPMVIDVLNMPVSLDYQLEAWNDYSIQIEDYTKLGIPQSAQTESGANIIKMVDPYSYRKNLTMPKMIFIGTIDEYWPVDAIKNYLDSIPGQNFIEYVPNAGHGLGDKKQAFQALSSFFSFTLKNEPYPVCTWELTENEPGIQLSAKASPELLSNAMIWYAESDDRDFRDEEWFEEPLDVKNTNQVATVLEYPDSGYKAFYIDLEYTDPNGDKFTESTRMFLADSTHVLVY